MPEEELEEGAQYGALPFDYYVTSYHDRARLVLAQINSPDFTNEQIQILSIHQSIHERNICANEEGTMQTVWLRTCYDKGLCEKYEEIKAEGEIDAEIGLNRYLDDSNRYAFDDGTPDHWRQVLVRVPGITDFMSIDNEEGSSNTGRARITTRFGPDVRS
ncbi:hypothetical protein N7467_000147 [Penicillium canescens]|nr:hypothetical protein N7467_000147 [Penicillium canescens]